MVLYYANIEDKKTLCSCGHKKGRHHYLRLVGDNTGECLCRGCDCTIYTEGE